MDLTQAMDVDDTNKEYTALLSAQAEKYSSALSNFRSMLTCDVYQVFFDDNCLCFAIKQTPASDSHCLQDKY